MATKKKTTKKTAKKKNKATTSPKKLTAKQEIFIREYIATLNATEAARRAGYSEGSARAIGVENLTKPVIKEAIEKQLAAYNEKLDISNERILNEYARCAFYNISNYFTPDGRMKSLSELDENAAAAIHGIDVHVIDEKSSVVKFKLPDKAKHLEALAKYQGLFEKDNEQKGTVYIEVAEYNGELD